MPAIKHAFQVLIRNRISTLFQRVVALNTIMVTPEELIKYTSPPEHREFLLNARNIIELTYWASDATLKWPLPAAATGAVTLNMHVDYHKTLAAMPKKPKLQKDADPEFIKRVDEWIGARVKAGKDWGLVEAVFEQLCDKCGSGEQIRFYWPTIMQLCSGNDEMVPLLDKMRAGKVPTNVPGISKGLADACRQTAAIVTMATLLPDASGEKSRVATLGLSGTENRYMLEGVGYVTPK